MTERRRVEVAGVDFGVVAVAVVIATWLVVNSWNWDAARATCAELIRTGDSDASATAVSECAEELLGK